ncbi:LIV-I protein F [Achromobacter xylosoxidans]|nr:LIV-I protein F [Achromobacter xylosoxidans]
MLKVSDLSSGYGKSQVLNGLNFEVNAGEIVTLIGANGAGKTTTLKTLCGVVPATAGRVEFEGRDLTNRTPYDIVDAGITMIPEGRQLFPHFTVRDNLLMGSYKRAAAPSCRASWRKCCRSSRGCASAWGSMPARCPAASSRWWRSRAA